MEPNLNNGALSPSAMALKDSLSPQARHLTRADDLDNLESVKLK